MTEDYGSLWFRSTQVHNVGKMSIFICCWSCQESSQSPLFKERRLYFSRKKSYKVLCTLYWLFVFLTYLIVPVQATRYWMRCSLLGHCSIWINLYSFSLQELAAITMRPISHVTYNNLSKDYYNHIWDFFETKIFTKE